MDYEKYRPKTLKEVFGNKNALYNLSKLFPNEHIHIYGGIGVGKTCSAIAVCNDNNMKYYRYSYEDYNNDDIVKGITYMTKMKNVKNTVIILDDAEEIINKAFVKELLLQKKCPVIIITNTKPYYPRTLSSSIKIIQFFKPTEHDINEYIKYLTKKYPEEKFILKRFVPDFRNTLINLLAYSDGYVEKTQYNVITNLLRKGEYEGFDEKSFSLLFDNIDNNYFSYDKLFAYQIVSLAAYTRRPEILSCLPKLSAVSLNQSTYLKKLSSKKYNTDNDETETYGE